MVVAATPRTTPEELLRDPELKNFELFDGQLVEKDVSLLSSYIAGQLFSHADQQTKIKKTGICLPDNTSIQCYTEDPNRVRKPDFLFVKAGRLSVEDFQSDGHLQIVPDAVAEVVSPNDNAYDVFEKVQEYLRAGVRLVWVVWPKDKAVQVYRQGGKGEVLNLGQELEGEEVIPGFRLKLEDLFAVPVG